MTSRGPVPLGQVADFELRFQYPEILRRDRFRTVTVISDLRSDVGALEAGNEVRAWLAERGWEGRIQYEVGGELESSREANAALFANLPLCFGAIVLLLVDRGFGLGLPPILYLVLADHEIQDQQRQGDA